MNIEKTMLSDEEKKAIDLLKNIDKQKCMMLECPVVKNNIERQLKIIELNRTIRKQSKELEELKSQIDEHVYNGCDYELCNKKWKTKIKAKIEELDYNDISNFERRCKQEVLQSLLEKE